MLVLSRGPEFSRGSACSQKGLNIIDALGGCADILVRYGGHAQAAGFTIANNHIEKLRERFNWNGQQIASRTAKVTGETEVEIADETGVVIEQETISARMLTWCSSAWTVSITACILKYVNSLLLARPIRNPSL